REVELPLLFDPLVVADDEGTELAGRALAGRPAADDQLLLGPDLDLQPRPCAPAGFVHGAPMFGDDALEALLACGLEEPEPLADDVIGESHSRVGRPQDGVQELLAALEGDVEERAAVEVQEVEDL